MTYFSEPENEMADTLVYAGTYTNKGGRGTYAFRFREEDGGLEPIGDPAKSESPSFLTIHPSRQYLYATNETDPGMVEESPAIAFKVENGLAIKVPTPSETTGV